jgi:hypothetical protein
MQHLPAAALDDAERLPARLFEEPVRGPEIVTVSDHGHRLMLRLSAGVGGVLDGWRCDAPMPALPEPGQCRWPDGCGEGRAYPSSYCPAHRALAYLPRLPKVTA